MSNKHPKPLQPKVPHSLLKTLSPDMLAEVDTRLMAGEGGLKVALWLQQEHKHFPEQKPDSLKKALERYRKKELRDKALQRIANVQRGNSIAYVAARLSALDQMDELVKVQRARLQKMLNLEEGKPMLLKQTTEEIRTLQTMLVNLGALQLETGVMARANRTISGIVTPLDGGVKEFTWTDAQEQLLQELLGVEGQSEAA